MPDLSALIAGWRADQLLKLTAVEVDELEDHLLQIVSDLSGHDLSEDERFLIAARRLGPASDLATELHGKSWAARRILLYVLGGWIGITILWDAILWISTGAMYFTSYVGGSGHAPQLVGITAQLAMWTAILGVVIRQPLLVVRSAGGLERLGQSKVVIWTVVSFAWVIANFAIPLVLIPAFYYRKLDWQSMIIDRGLELGAKAAVVLAIVSVSTWLMCRGLNFRSSRYVRFAR